MVFAPNRCDNQLQRLGSAGTSRGERVNIRRGLAAGAVISTAVAAAVVMESDEPAHAVAPPPDGTYTVNIAGAAGATWTITALCDQVNGSRYYKDYDNPEIMADFCALNVVSATPYAATNRDQRLQNFSGRARLSGGLWTFQVKKSEGASCPGGSYGESADTYAFDNTTFAGTHTVLHDAVCGLQPDMKKEPFSLQLIGPPPSPIERYPLQCNDLAMCF
jgi:hypothetical protein